MPFIMNFATPGYATDPYFASVVALLNMQGSNGSDQIIDDSNYNHLVHAGSYTLLSTGWAAYGLTSLKDPQDSADIARAGGVSLIETSSEFDLGSSNFTMESTVYLTAYPGFQDANFTDYFAPIASNAGGLTTVNATTANGGWAWAIVGSTSTNSVKLFTSIGTVTWANTNLALNTAYELAVVRSSSSWSLYINGTLFSTQTLSGTVSRSAVTRPLAVGAWYCYGDTISTTNSQNLGHGFPGYINRFRLTIGVARYSGASYSVETNWPGAGNTWTSPYNASTDPWGNRGVWAGGNSGTAISNSILYMALGANTGVTPSSFGTLGTARANGTAVTNKTRGVFVGGHTTTAGTTITSNMEYVTIGSTGNGTSFGTMTTGRRNLAGACDTTRGLVAGGTTSSNASASSAQIQYITTASAGNATNFGNLNSARDFIAGVSSATRAVFFGGRNTSSVPQQTGEYVTIQTTGNASLFGNLTAATYIGGGMDNKIKGLLGGNRPTSGATYQTQVFTIDSLALATVMHTTGIAHYGANTMSDGKYGFHVGGSDSATENGNSVSVITLHSFYVPGAASKYGALSSALRSQMGTSGQ